MRYFHAKLKVNLQFYVSVKSNITAVVIMVEPFLPSEEKLIYLFRQPRLLEQAEIQEIFYYHLSRLKRVLYPVRLTTTTMFQTLHSSLFLFGSEHKLVR